MFTAGGGKKGGGGIGGGLGGSGLGGGGGGLAGGGGRFDQVGVGAASMLSAGITGVSSG